MIFMLDIVGTVSLRFRLLIADGTDLILVRAKLDRCCIKETLD